MNGMLQHHELYRESVRRQQEARQWAQHQHLGRLGRIAHQQVAEHPVRTRLLAVASPVVAVITLIAIGGAM